MKCRECAYRGYCAEADISLDKISELLRKTLEKAKKENNNEPIVQTACYLKSLVQKTLDLWIDFIDCLTKG